MFRERYLSYAELILQLTHWADAHPDIAQLRSLGTTPEGRDIPLLIVGRSPTQTKPAVWVDGNMHASEFCGSNVCLAIAEELIALHVGDSPSSLPEHMQAAIRGAHFYIAPRLSPDGAEAVLATGRYVRSSPADTRTQRAHPHWQQQDINGDGAMGYMRQESPNGELVELRDAMGNRIGNGVLVPRQLDDPGPYYKVYPEGVIANFDGHTIPDPYFLSDNETDFNRNFPYQWGSEDVQRGAGQYPGSTPETRAILEFARQHPNIYAWVNFHTFGGVFLRPFGDKPDHDMDPADLAVYKHVEAWAREFTGYPMVSGYHEFQYEPGTPVRGILTDYAYHQRGALAYGVELWDIFTQIGMADKKRFIDKYTEMTRDDLRRLVGWDSAHNQNRIFRPWQPVNHAQIGAVEVGGIDLRVGISNPPYERLDQVCRDQTAAFLRVAATLPQVEIEVVTRESLAGGITSIAVRIRNLGYLGTHGISSAKQLPHVEPLRVSADCAGVELISPVAPAVEIGHLDGWGRGPHGGMSIFAPWTRGSGGDATVNFVVAGTGTLTVLAESSRVGSTRLVIAIS